MSQKNLPPLEVQTSYRAQDFESFEYFGSKLTGSTAILRLHLANETTIDLPANDDELRRLALVLTGDFGPHVIDYLKSNGWI